MDPVAATPPYEQVRAQLEGLIRAGELARGTRLPTVQQLSLDLGLTVNTVARAYKELETDRLVETRGRNGTFVLASRSRHNPARPGTACFSVHSQSLQGGSDDRAEVGRGRLAGGEFRLVPPKSELRIF